jgi:hypothetical protein
MNISSLPQEILLSIAKWLNISTLIHLISTCKGIKEELVAPYYLNFSPYKNSVPYFNSAALKQKFNQIIRLEASSKLPQKQLVFLVRNGHLDILRILELHSYPLTVIQDCFTISAMHSEYYHGKIAYSLLKSNPTLNINLPSHPLLCASTSGNPDLVDFLLTYEIPSSTINSAILLASKHNRPSCLKSLLSHPNSDPTLNNNEAIRSAATYGHLKPFKLLIRDPRVDASSNSNAALQNASEHGHLLVIIILLQDPRVVNLGLESSLHLAHVYGHVECARYLFKKALEDLDRYKLVCLKFTCKIGDASLLKKLLGIVQGDKSLLFVVVKHDRVECLKVLIDYGIDPTVEGNKALKMAREMGLVEIVKVLEDDERVLERERMDKLIPEKWIRT